MTDINAELRELRKLKLEAVRTKDIADAAAEAFTIKQMQVYSLMEAEDVSTTKVGGVTYTKSATAYAQVQDSSAFEAWAEENMPEVLEKKPRKALLNQLVKQYIEDGTPLPPGLGHYVREYISQRGSSDS